jgi:hypothetical protein
MEIKWSTLLLYVFFVLTVTDNVAQIIDGTATYYDYGLVILLSIMIIGEIFCYVKFRRRAQEG